MLKVYIIIFFIAVLTQASAQNDSLVGRGHCKYPFVAGVDFQNFALPFHDMKSNFSHPGLSVGTEMSLNKKSTLVQQLNAAFTINEEMGSAFYIYTQAAFRHRIYRPLFGEIKLGVGWQRCTHPTDAYKFEKGEWKKINGGKSLLIIPVGISLSYKPRHNDKLIPFISYQVIPSLFYDDVLPISFYNIYQVGVRVNFNSINKK